MNRGNERRWRFNRQVDVATLVQVVLLASLIVGSWVNLQRQLDLLQRDVDLLLERHKTYAHRLDRLQEDSIGHEYRLRAVEEIK